MRTGKNDLIPIYAHPSIFVSFIKTDLNAIYLVTYWSPIDWILGFDFIFTVFRVCRGFLPVVKDEPPNEFFDTVSQKLKIVN